MPDVRSLLSEGLIHEKEGNWTEAFAYWQDCSSRWPDVIQFWLRLAGVALKLQKPEDVLAAANKARELDPNGDHSTAIEGLETRAEKLQVSLFRIRGMEAFEAGDFETARSNLAELARAVPDHPWAAARARQAAGLSPLFAQRLAEQLPQVSQRVFVTGCGRSGTWLMASMLHCIPEIRKAEQESPLGAFLEMPDEPKIHFVKRTHDAYKYFDRIPADIKVIHVIRHPYDVLCSRHRETEKYISLSRLEAEHAACFTHLKDRPNTLIVKYEDLVLHPSDIQSETEGFLGVKSATPFSEFYRSATMNEGVADAMHGIRPLDRSALHRWKKNAEDRTYLRDLVKQSDGTLERFALNWNYDLSLPM